MLSPVNDAKITDAVIPIFKMWKRLRYLSLKGTNFTPAEREALDKQYDGYFE
jgi:hypothetical protein